MSSLTGKKQITATWALKYIPKWRGRGYRAKAVNTEPKDVAGGIVCRECGVMKLSLVAHVERIHSMTCAAYRERHGADAPLVTDDLKAEFAERLRKIAAAAHAERGWRVCERCGAKFEKPLRKHGNAYCSRDCYLASMSEFHRTQEMQDVARANAKSSARLAYIDGLHADKIERMTRACPQCGRDFVASRKSKIGYCSVECRGEAKAVKAGPGQPCCMEPGCGRRLFARGLCTRHYRKNRDAP